MSEITRKRRGRKKPLAKERAGRSRADFEAHKYSLTDRETSATEPREAAPPRTIPSAYGRDRVTALAVDPERLYVYWEVTDEASERSRAGLGPGGVTAWLSLRVYDTTGRLFDGTNAHGYSDHRIENGSRQWFVEIGKPGSEAFVEIGMRSREGSFVRIARSGRVVFPRRSPAAHREPQWLTVRADPEAPSVVSSPGIEGRREPPTTTRVWDAGPFAFPPHVREPVSETYAGESSAFEVDGRAHVVFGPWQVVVREMGASEEGRVLTRWTVYRSWAVESGREAPFETVHQRMLGSSGLLGGSESRFVGASERRYAAASERLLRGGSDRRLGGASGRR